MGILSQLANENLLLQDMFQFSINKLISSIKQKFSVENLSRSSELH
jgi:hypothetical protein